MSRELIQLAQGIINTAGQGHVYPFYVIKAMEDEIERRGLQIGYGTALMRALGIGDHQEYWDDSLAEALFLVLRATPEQKAKAFLEAIK
jgi:hypothetical protein